METRTHSKKRGVFQKTLRVGKSKLKLLKQLLKNHKRKHKLLVQNLGLPVLDQETIPVRTHLHVQKIINVIIHNVVN